MANFADVLSEEQKNKLNAISKSDKTKEKRPRVEREHKGKRLLDNGLPYATKFYPESSVKVALVIKHNAEFRRMISLAIKNSLIESGEIKPEDKVYITYLWNKFSVKINNLSREYPYANQMFVNNFAAAIVLMSSYAQQVLMNFSNEEDIEVDVEYANNITSKIHPKSSENEVEDTEDAE